MRRRYRHRHDARGKERAGGETEARAGGLAARGHRAHTERDSDPGRLRGASSREDPGWAGRGPGVKRGGSGGRPGRRAEGHSGGWTVGCRTRWPQEGAPRTPPGGPRGQRHVPPGARSRPRSRATLPAPPSPTASLQGPPPRQHGAEGGRLWLDSGSQGHPGPAERARSSGGGLHTQNPEPHVFAGSPNKLLRYHILS